MIAYHGTSSVFLDSILERGLIPEPDRKVWAEDPGTGLHTQSRVSLPGTYFALNFLTATGAAQTATMKFGGRKLIVIIEFDPESAFPDEDNIRPVIRRAIHQYLHQWGGFNLHMEHFTDVVGWLDAMEGFAEVEGAIGIAASQMLAQFLTDFVVHAEGVFADVPDITQHSELWIDVLKAYAMRRSAYDHDWYFRSHYARGVELATWQLHRKILETPLQYGYDDDRWYEEYEKLKALGNEIEEIGRELQSAVYDLDIQPPRAHEAEAAYLDLVHIITLEYPHWVKREIEDSVGLRSFRLVQPVGFSGKNRIVGIVELPQYGEPKDALLHYGDAPSVFIEDYRQYTGPDYRIVDVAEDSI